MYLFNVTKPAQPFLYVFFGRVVLVRRQNSVRFLFQHVDHEFVNGFVSGRVGTLLHFFEQLAVNLHFV